MIRNVGQVLLFWAAALLALLLVACGSPEPAATTPATDTAEAPAPAEEQSQAAEEAPPTVATTATVALPDPTSTSPPEATSTRRSILSTGADEDSSEPAPTAEVVAEAAAEAVQTETNMAVSAVSGPVELNTHPDSFQAPQSFSEITGFDESGWQTLNPGEEVTFAIFDGLRVGENGEAVLGLGDSARLLLKRGTEIQSLAATIPATELARIRPDLAQDPSLLQRMAEGVHLLRGGFVDESVAGEPLLLSTPNAIFVVEALNSFLVYDADSGITWAGNFDGVIDATDLAMGLAVPLPAGQLVAIPAIGGRQSWSLADNLTPGEFEGLIDQLGSPVAAAEMISGPYLYGVFNPDLAVRNGPGSEFAYVGTLERGEYVRVIGQGRTWWQIECPQNTNSPGSECWVSGGNQYTRAFNTANVPVTAKAATQTPTSMPSATPTKSATPQLTVTAVSPTPEVTKPAGTAPGDVFDCRYLGNGKFEWYTGEGGPFTGTWQSGCPAAPSISFDGCAVTWSAGSNNVVSASISLKKVGTVYGEAYDQTDEFGAALPDGTQGFSLPAGFIGKVTASLNSQLDNGNSDSTSATHSFDSQCSS
jgi:hypothetical protein